MSPLEAVAANEDFHHASYKEVEKLFTKKFSFNQKTIGE